ncbi:ParB/RepB/Spo0J family partition protein [Streptosporangium sp. NPDC051023]|uniref:ParB/RepB/Spo0J family partition protein n=1 Tax=Streptosporangium sp. NPDC051023 TaxID=3155410 RepID=UPI00344F2567
MKTDLPKKSQAGEEVPGEDFRLRLSAVETVPIHALLPADSPRSIGEDLQHVRLLSELDTVFPPVIVHRSTMRVVDGMHRLRAATLRNEKDIRARFFEGDEHDAFVVAVKENTAHGLPLSAGDRAAAARRIVQSHPHWSDRTIAGIAGLSARTVSDIRRAACPEGTQPTARLGRDGRVRPLDSSASRIRAAELIEKRPHTSLRQIAQQAGISPSTVRDVRDRLRRGEDPLPTSLRPATGTPLESTAQNPPNASSAPLSDIAPELRSVPTSKYDRGRMSPLNSLIRDPSLRSEERGRTLLRMLSASASLTSSQEQLIDAIPEHCVGLVYQAARESAAAWAEFAEKLERRAVRLRARTQK